MPNKAAREVFGSIDAEDESRAERPLAGLSDQLGHLLIGETRAMRRSIWREVCSCFYLTAAIFWRWVLRRDMVRSGVCAAALGRLTSGWVVVVGSGLIVELRIVRCLSTVFNPRR